MSIKTRIGILFGGRSGEHEISLLSAASILKAIDRTKYDVVPIGISKSGRWLTGTDAVDLLAGSYDPSKGLETSIAGDGGALPGTLRTLGASAGLEMAEHAASLAVDVIFPVLHGTFGEDGTIQGLLELAGVAYVGSGVLGSAAGMDKDVMKRLFAAAGLPQTPYVTLLRSEWKTAPEACRARIESALTYPLFVKPANLGSSVGISKVHDRTALDEALHLAAKYDRKLVIEQGVGGPGVKPRELEVGVLGNDVPEVSMIGEIVPNREFYDYDSKYSASASPSVPVIPAVLTSAQEKEVHTLAIAAFRACDAAGLARVDFLMEPVLPGREAKILLNEINTMPGFTNISMYPKLWEASGVSYGQLIERLIGFAGERQQERLETRFDVDGG